MVSVFTDIPDKRHLQKQTTFSTVTSYQLATHAHLRSRRAKKSIHPSSKPNKRFSRHLSDKTKLQTPVNRSVLWGFPSVQLEQTICFDVNTLWCIPRNNFIFASTHGVQMHEIEHLPKETHTFPYPSLSPFSPTHGWQCCVRRSMRRSGRQW